MAASDSKGAVIAAIGGNFIVMVAKFGAFGISGSAAMLSEAVHTAADLLNQILLLIGIVRSSKGADERFHYGYGRERYIWALMSAVGIFFLGCGVTVYHGVDGLLHPHEPGDLGWAIGVLIFSLLVEGIVLALAFRSLWRLKNNKPFLTYLRDDADPASVAVLLEDSAACLGVLMALGGIGLTIWTGQPWWDALSSILIGLLLGAVAIWLIMRNTWLLRGPSIPQEAAEKVKEILEANPAVEEVVELKSRMVDLTTWDIMANVEFRGEALAERMEPQIQAAWAEIKSYDDFRAFASRYADDVVQALGDEVDKIEKSIQESVPEAKHLDIETH